MNRTTRIAPARKLNVNAGWRLTMAAAAALVSFAFASSLAIADTEAFHASYQGIFKRTASGGSSVLEFSGTGVATVLGSSTISGNTVFQVTSPTCSTIVQDKVTLTAANGDQVFVQNSGQDCIDPGTGRITGSGTYTITGGTGRFMGVSGTGTFSVTAQVTSPPDANPASGTFNPLTFDGTISLPCNQ